MNLKTLFFLTFIIACISCNTIKHGKSPMVDKENAMQFPTKYSFTDSMNIANFESELFASDALNKYSINSINKEFLNYLSCTKTAIANKYNVAIVDTIYTYSNSKNRIQIYRAKENDFIVTFDVSDSIYKLSGNVKPGISKDFFVKKFKITKPINSKVQISNNEGTMRFMFYFENNSIKRISSYLYLD
jgi:hypothetical protein